MGRGKTPLGKEENEFGLFKEGEMARKKAELPTPPVFLNRQSLLSSKKEEGCGDTKGRQRSSCRSWTIEEKGFLSKNYSVLGATQCAKILQRTPESVRKQAGRLGLRWRGEYNIWSHEEDAFLQRNYDILGVKECARALGRTKGSIRYRLRVLKRREKENRAEVSSRPRTLLARFLRFLRLKKQA